MKLKEFRKRKNLSQEAFAKSIGYKALKFSDGVMTEEEYAPIRAQRQAWRDEINELESKT